MGRKELLPEINDDNEDYSSLIDGDADMTALFEAKHK